MPSFLSTLYANIKREYSVPDNDPRRLAIRQSKKETFVFKGADGNPQYFNYGDKASGTTMTWAQKLRSCVIMGATAGAVDKAASSGLRAASGKGGKALTDNKAATHQPVALSAAEVSTTAALENAVKKTAASADHSPAAMAAALNQAAGKPIDYRTSNLGDDTGAPVRNVLTLRQGVASGHITGGAAGTITADEIMALIRGRPYLTIVAPDGDPSKTIIFKNDAVNKNEPGALLISTGGCAFEPWISSAPVAALTVTSPDSHVVLHGHAFTVLANALDENGQPILDEAHPCYHELQSGAVRHDGKYEEDSPPSIAAYKSEVWTGKERGNTCGMHAINNLLGRAAYTQSSWDKTIAELRASLKPEALLHNAAQQAREIHAGAFASEVAQALRKELAGSKTVVCSGHGVPVEHGAGDEVLDDDDLSVIENALNLDGLILFNGNHYVSFLKQDEPPGWVMLDSMHSAHRNISPSAYYAETRASMSSDAARATNLKAWGCIALFAQDAADDLPPLPAEDPPPAAEMDEVD